MAACRLQNYCIDFADTSRFGNCLTWVLVEVCVPSTIDRFIDHFINLANSIAPLYKTRSESRTCSNDKAPLGFATLKQLYS